MWFRRVLEHLPVGAYACDADGRITYFNPQSVRLWGREPKLNDAADRYCGAFHLYAPDGPAVAHDRCAMAQALREKRECAGREVVIERPDGERTTVLAYANPIHDESGRLLGAVSVLVDISQRRCVEQTLELADRAKHEFLAHLSHELRTPLNTIFGWVQLLRSPSFPAEQVPRALETIEHSARAQARLITDILDVYLPSRPIDARLLRGATILVVDDEPEARDVLKFTLESCGASVVTAPSVALALEHVDRAPPDVIFCDLEMPEEDGFCFIRSLRSRESSRGGQVPVVALTASAGAETRDRAVSAGFQLHVAKPADPGALVHIAARLRGASR